MSDKEFVDIDAPVPLAFQNKHPKNRLQNHVEPIIHHSCRHHNKAEPEMKVMQVEIACLIGPADEK